MDLFIYNYTAKTQFEWKWTPETRVCRGLIVDDFGNIVARPFEKLFGADQLSDSDLIWSKPFTVTGKIDGSLIICGSSRAGIPVIASRGSFDSEQAIRATKIVRKKHPLLAVYPGLTALFEIVYKENRIVCDYGEIEDLFLIAVVDNKTGLDLFDGDLREAANYIRWSGKLVQSYSANCKPRDVIKHLGLPEDGSVEGVVLKFEYPKGKQTRVKIKTDEYRRLHRLVTGLNKTRIWEELSSGRGLKSLLETALDEYHSWIRGVRNELETSYSVIENTAKNDFKVLDSRKETALYFQTTKYPAILFAMLDEKDYGSVIWKMIKPKGDL